MKKEKYTLEYDMKAIPPAILWNYIHSDMGLSEWFCDEAKASGREYVFIWNGYSQNARVMLMRQCSFVRFRWTDSEDADYFEMKISKSELTEDTVLTIVDFSLPEEKNDDIELWNTQVEKLKRILGC